MNSVIFSQIFKKDFIYLGESKQAQAGAGKEEQREREKQGAPCGARPQDPEITTRAKGRRATDRATQVLP